MQSFYCFGRGDVQIPGMTAAICEGGAGWLRGQSAPQMTLGGWDAMKAARNAKVPLPPVDPVKARAYWSLTRQGDVVLSNFYEDRFDAWHAKQVVAALTPAQSRLVVAHYGFPSFVRTGFEESFWAQVRDLIDIITPAYYAEDDGPVDAWTDTDYQRMAYQLRTARDLMTPRHRLGFVVSPQTHGGKDILLAKAEAQVRFLLSFGVEYFFAWSAQGDTPANRAFAQLLVSIGGGK